MKTSLLRAPNLSSASSVCLWTGILLFTLGVKPSLGQWQTQTVKLKPGWSAIYLHVDASHISLDSLIANDPGNPIAEIWLWQPNPSVQFTDSPQEPTTTDSQWLQWGLVEGISDTLTRLVGNGAYLVHNTSKSEFTWKIKGKPAPFRFDWTVDGANFVGFPTPANKPPVFDNFLAQSPPLYDGVEVFSYVGGELNQDNPAELTTYFTTPVTRGEAYWVRREGIYNDYYGPFKVTLEESSGIDFRDSLGQRRVRLKNLTSVARTITMSLLASETAPSGQPEVVAQPPLLVRGAINASNLTYRYTRLDYDYVYELAPAGETGAEVEIVLGLHRWGMSEPAGSHYAGILRFTDAGGLTENDIPVSATVAGNGGLWVGKANVTHVGHYLKTYLEDEDGALVTSELTEDGAPYIATSTNSSLGKAASSFPLRLIMHHNDQTGEINLLQRAFVGLDTATNVIVGTQESFLAPDNIDTAVRISAAHLPFTLENKHWVGISIESSETDDAASEDTNSAITTNVTVGVFSQASDGSYSATGIELVFAVQAECQTWTRTAREPDEFDSTPGHLHYNAALNTTYDGTTFTWTEYGPEHSQADIEAVCAAGAGGVTKTVNSIDYREDHPGVFLRITKVEESGGDSGGSGGDSGGSEATVVGAFQPGSGFVFNVPLGHHDQASNPFLHTFHPDHDNLKADFKTVEAQGQESYTVTRRISLIVSEPADDFDSLTATTSERTGSYQETITFSGLGSSTRQFTVAGIFDLNLILPISQLTAQ